MVILYSVSQALERDGYRCLLQPSVLHQAAAAYGVFPDRRGCRLEYLQCAHIFPPSTMQGMSDTDKVCQAFCRIVKADCVLKLTTESLRYDCAGDVSQIRKCGRDRFPDWAR